MVDHRKVIGNLVKAKAIHVTNLAECARKYGANSKTFVVQGHVVDVVTDINPGQKVRTTKITADYDLGLGEIKQATLNIVSVHKSFQGEQLNPMVSQALPDAPEDIVVEARQLFPVDDNNNNETIAESTSANNNTTTSTTNNTTIVNNVVQQTATTVTATATTVTATTTGVAAAAGVINNTIQPPANVIVVNNTIWKKPSNEFINKFVNGSVFSREWGVRDNVTGDVLRSGCNVNERLSPFDVFLLMFPPKALDIIANETNKQLTKERKKRQQKEKY